MATIDHDPPVAPRRRSRQRQLFLLFLPGFLVAGGTIMWGLWLQPTYHQVPQWRGAWIEPKQPSGRFKSWRTEDGAVVGETEPWPHKHPRANSYLLSEKSSGGDASVQLTVRFLRGRYLGCYLCYDPEKKHGYWLSTGHAVGKYPGKAYIKIVHGPDDKANGEGFITTYDGSRFKTTARAPLEIQPNRDYVMIFRREGDELAILVDDNVVVTWRDGTYKAGRVQLRLHNTKVRISDLKVSK